MFNISRQSKQDDVRFAILNVIKKRQMRNISNDNLRKYLNHLKIVWRNDSKILEFIDEQLIKM